MRGFRGSRAAQLLSSAQPHRNGHPGAANSGGGNHHPSFQSRPDVAKSLPEWMKTPETKEREARELQQMKQQQSQQVKVGHIQSKQPIQSKQQMKSEPKSERPALRLVHSVTVSQSQPQSKARGAKSNPAKLRAVGSQVSAAHAQAAQKTATASASAKKPARSSSGRSAAAVAKRRAA